MAPLFDAESLFITTVLTGPLAICLALQVAHNPAPGPAQLVLEPAEVTHADEFLVRRVIRPELPPAPGAPGPRGPELALVVDALGPHVVLEVDPSTDLEHGPVRWVDPEGEGDTVAALAPREWATEPGAQVVLYGAAGEVCRGTMGAPALLSRLEYYDIDLLMGPDEYETHEQEDGSLQVPPERELELAWENGDRLVAAPVVDLEGDCDGALWARGAELPAPLVLTPGGRDRETARAFRRSHVFGQLRQEWEEYGGDHEYESTFREAVSKHVASIRWQDPDGHTLRTTVEVANGWGGCGDFEANAWGVMGEGKLVAERESISPVAVFDVDRDGRFELVVAAAGSNLHTDRALLRETDDSFEWLAHATRSFHGCPC